MANWAMGDAASHKLPIEVAANKRRHETAEKDLIFLFQCMSKLGMGL
jgi:hypothetical protein